MCVRDLTLIYYKCSYIIHIYRNIAPGHSSCCPLLILISPLAISLEGIIYIRIYITLASAHQIKYIYITLTIRTPRKWRKIAFSFRCHTQTNLYKPYIDRYSSRKRVVAIKYVHIIYGWSKNITYRKIYI